MTDVTAATHRELTEREELGPPTGPRAAGAGLLIVIRRRGGAWGREHWLDLVVVAVLVAIAGTVHSVGMANYPIWIDDPGTYLSQAWAVQYTHTLSPYSYFYDHAPGGWIQLGLWSAVSNGFGRHRTAIDFGNECMLIAKCVSCLLMYALARRLSFGYLWSMVAVLLFALCPLALVYTRWTYLDNLVTPWLLLAFLLAASPRRHLLATAGAGFAFANAALTKETALVVAPALVAAIWQNTDRRTRLQSFVVAGLTGSWMLLYPAYAMIKGEFFAGPGHNSLLGTAVWQLHQRTRSGSVLDPASVTRKLWGDWMQYDRYLIYAGIAAVAAGLVVRRLRPVALVFCCQSVVLFTGGYVPFMHIISLLPWAALALGGVGANLAHRELGRRTRWVPQVAAVLALAAFVAQVGPRWYQSDRQMMAARTAAPLRQAGEWVAANVPRSKVVVVHDALWTDLVAKDGFDPSNVIIVYKLDSDPAVREAVHHLDYLVLPDFYYITAKATSQYPTVLLAKDRAIAVAHFGDDVTSSVTVYRVSAAWSPT